MKLRAVIFDWAGTLVDFGSRAPVSALQSVFAEAGVPINVAEVRESMGLAKKEHIRSILEIPRVRTAWAEKCGAAPSDNDVDRLYGRFIPSQISTLEHHSRLISGVADAAGRMRSRGLKIGTTTGYNRAMLKCLLERAKDQDFVPDSAICPDDVPAGRPFPWMCYLTAIRLEVCPMSALVKIGDTPADIEEGRNARMWTIGVTRTGNEVGVTEEEWAALSKAEKDALVKNAARRLLDAGAHYVSPSGAECDGILEDIEERLSRGEQPR